MTKSTFLPSGEQLVSTFVRNMRRGRDIAAAQQARDAMIKRHYADPTGVPFGGPRKPPERGAAGIAGMRADLRDGVLTLPTLRAATVGALARRYRISKPSASRARARLLAGDSHRGNGKHVELELAGTNPREAADSKKGFGYQG